MRNLFIAILFLTGFIDQAMAQSLPETNWEFGHDLLWIIDSERPATNLIVRKNFMNANENPRAIRGEIGFNFRIDQGHQFKDKRAPYFTREYLIHALAGYEFLHDFRNFRFFYGPDIHFTYNRIYEESELYAGTVLNELTTFSRTYGAGFFFGARYYVIPKVALSLESRYGINHTYFKRHGHSIQQGGGNWMRDVNRWNTEGRLMLLNKISISISF